MRSIQAVNLVQCVLEPSIGRDQKLCIYACRKEEAAKIGFDDQFIYEQLSLPIDQRSITMKQISPNQYQLPFQTWEKSKDKKQY